MLFIYETVFAVWKKKERLGKKELGIGYWELGFIRRFIPETW
jgi:hypothetical protein